MDELKKQHKKLWQNRYYIHNKQKFKDASKRWAENNKEKTRLAQAKYRAKNRERINAHCRLYYQQNKEALLVKYRILKREYYRQHSERLRALSTTRVRLNKFRVISHYSNNKNICACCNESEIGFLTVDHINGGGLKHLRELNIKGGRQFYEWLIRNKFPEGFQVLCYNCNCAKGRFGVCPHQKLENLMPFSSNLNASR